MHIYPYIHTYPYTCVNTYFTGISVQKGTRYLAIDFASGESKEGVTGVAGAHSTGPLGGGFTKVSGGLRVGFTGVTAAKPTSPATESDNLEIESVHVWSIGNWEGSTEDNSV
jgi:hypothetical protein